MGHYLQRYQDFFDKFLFIIFAITGGFLIWFGRSHDFNVIFLYSFIVSLMVLYGFYCFNSEYFKIRSDKAGDNIYYLGFIYTLVSLGVSLYTSTQQDHSTEMIISNFGVAIITTIIGVTGRVFFLQLRDTPQEIENESLYGLNDSARKLKVTLDNTISDFSIFRTTLKQSINEVHSEFQSGCQKHFEELEELHKNALKKMEERSEEIDKKYVDISLSLSNVIAKIEQIDIPKAVFIDKLEEPINDFRFILNEITDTISKRIERVNELEQSLVNFSNLEAEFATIINNLSKYSHDQINLSKQVMVDMINYQDSFKEYIEKATTDFREVQGTTNNSLEVLDDTYKNLANNISDKSEKLLTSYKDISDNALKTNNKINERLEQQNKCLDKLLIVDIEKYSNSLKERIEDIYSVSSVMDNLIKNEEKLTRMINQSIESADFSINGMQLIGKRFSEGIKQLSGDIQDSNKRQTEITDKIYKITEHLAYHQHLDDSQKVPNQSSKDYSSDTGKSHQTETSALTDNHSSRTTKSSFFKRFKNQS